MAHWANKSSNASTNAAWLKWLADYGTDKFLEAFLRNVENAESVCIYCQEKIYVDVLIGGGVPDWCTESGDFGCDGASNPDVRFNKQEEAWESGAHMPRKRA